MLLITVTEKIYNNYFIQMIINYNNLNVTLSTYMI